MVISAAINLAIALTCLVRKFALAYMHVASTQMVSRIKVEVRVFDFTFLIMEYEPLFIFIP